MGFLNIMIKNVYVSTVLTFVYFGGRTNGILKPKTATFSPENWPADINPKGFPRHFSGYKLNPYKTDSNCITDRTLSDFPNILVRD